MAEQSGKRMMMSVQTLTGEKVVLKAVNFDEDMSVMADWDLDSEYQRLLNGGPAKMYHATQIKEFFEKEIGEMHFFIIYSREDNRKIGLVDLSGFDWQVGNAFIGIGIGDRELWGQGYGTDAMRTIVRYGFEEVNLRRLSLTVFDFNERARKSYAKVGFVEEGRLPGVLLKSNKRYDLIFMRIMRSDWLAGQSG
jgi:RimJ/RimL family protein N-acetyltransferase